MAAHTAVARSVILALAAMSGKAIAGQFDYSLYGSLEHSDNIALSSNNPDSVNILTPGATFSYLEQGSTFQANVTGDLEYHAYSGSLYDNQTQFQLAGQANWTVMPQRLDLFVQDYAGIQPVDSLASNAPDNQQQTNVIAIGPTLHFRLGEATTGQAELHYVNSYASKVKDFNSSRGDAALRVFRDVSPTSQVSLNGEYQHVDFSESAAGPNYSRSEFYATYDKQLAHLNANFALGWTYIDYAGSSTKSLSDPLARVTIGWSPTVTSTFTLSADYQYVDAAESLLQPTTVTVGGQVEQLQPLEQMMGDVRGGINIGTTVISSDVYKERRVDASYGYQTERLTLSVSPVYSRLSYPNDSAIDQTAKGLGVSSSYKLRPQLTLSGFVTGDRTTYDNINRNDRTYRYGADLGYQWSKHWSGHVSYVRQVRSSDAAAQSYHENEYFLTLVYRR